MVLIAIRRIPRALSETTELLQFVLELEPGQAMAQSGAGWDPACNCEPFYLCATFETRLSDGWTRGANRYTRIDHVGLACAYRPELKD